MPPDPILLNPVAPRPRADPGRSLLNFARKLTNCFLDVIAAVIILGEILLTTYTLLSVFVVLLQDVVDTASRNLTPVCTTFSLAPICHRVEIFSSAGATDAHLVYGGNVVDFPKQSTAGSQLAFSLKQAELAVQDLGTLVKDADILTKDAVAQVLEGFIADAKVTGRGLQQLSAKLNEAVDKIIAFDNYAMRNIAIAQASGDPNIQSAVIQTLYASMNVLASQVSAIILETTAFASRLDDMEERLGAINVLCQQENIRTTAEQENVAFDLGTYLGGNRGKIFRLSQQVVVLQNVARYRSLAAAHVAATVEALGAIDAELTQLREKLTAPELVDGFPIETQIASIDRSARGLKDLKG